MADRVFGILKDSVASVADTTGAIAKQKLLQRLIASGVIETEQIRDCLQTGVKYFFSPTFDKIDNDSDYIQRQKFKSEIVGKKEQFDFDIEAHGLAKFRSLLAIYGIESNVVLRHIENGKFREVSNPASSGSLLFLTEDSSFLIKSLRDYEVKFIQQIFLNEYFDHLLPTEGSFIVKLFGNFSFIPYLSQRVQISVDSFAQRFAVYSNCIPTNLEIHEKYDLKGSTYRRDANITEKQKSSATLKDNDFRMIHPEGLTIEPDVYDYLRSVFDRDVQFLERLKIMDYSLLLTIHNIDNQENPRPRGALELLCGGFTDPLLIGMGDDYRGNNKSDSAGKPRKKVLQFDRQVRTTQMGYKETSNLGISNLRDFGGIPAVNEKGERILLFLGIIDILQTYDAAKNMQTLYQTVENPNVTRERSIVEPGFYARRFLEFIFGSVFRRNEKQPTNHPVIMMVPKINQTRRSMQSPDEETVRF